MSNQSQNTENLPTTPDWSKAPDWAMWWAKDKDGLGLWYRSEPVTNDEYDGWDTRIDGLTAYDDEYDSANWDCSKQQRPQSEATIHDDDIAVDLFAEKMKAKLAKKRNQGYNAWHTCPVEELQNGLYTHLPKGDPIDIANYCMFLDARFEPIAPPSPKIENLTVQLNTDISGYLAEKNSFITGLVDLLLARMAKEERFSDDENVIDNHRFKDFDIVTFINANRGNAKSYAVVVNQIDNNDIELSHIIYQHDVGGFRLFGNAYFGNLFKEIRTINELEAVEFRQAMEAVYG